jgi:hypothetical protein
MHLLPGVPKSAADLLSLMSFFDRHGIPEALLRSQTRQRNTQLDLSWRSSDDEDDNEDSESQFSESDEFEKDILALRNYSFISVTFEMHGLVQLAMRKWLEANGQLEKWKRQNIKNLCAEFPTENFENWAKC